MDKVRYWITDLAAAPPPGTQSVPDVRAHAERGHEAFHRAGVCELTEARAGCIATSRYCLSRRGGLVAGEIRFEINGWKTIAP
jgi:hypothetical protein